MEGLVVYNRRIHQGPRTPGNHRNDHAYQLAMTRLKQVGPTKATEGFLSVADTYIANSSAATGGLLSVANTCTANIFEQLRGGFSL